GSGLQLSAGLAVWRDRAARRWPPLTVHPPRNRRFESTSLQRRARELQCALISAVTAAGNSQYRYAIEPRLRCLQLSRERQEGSFLTIAAGKVHADRQAVCRPVQRYAHRRRARRVVQRRHRQIFRHPIDEGLHITVLVEIAEHRRRAGQGRRQDHVIVGQEPGYLAPRAACAAAIASMYSTPLTFSPCWYTAHVTVSTSSALGSRPSAFHRTLHDRAVLAAEIRALNDRSAAR